MKARTPEELVSLFNSKLAGRTIAGLRVHGVNSLKTLEPAPESLAGHTIDGFTSTGEATFEFTAGPVTVDVDLQRVGKVSWTASATPWVPGASTMPAAQLLLEDGSGVDFVEPGKTMRITFRLLRA